MSKIFNTYGYDETGKFVSMVTINKLKFNKNTHVTKDYTQIQQFFSEDGQPTVELNQYKFMVDDNHEQSPSQPDENQSYESPQESSPLPQESSPQESSPLPQESSPQESSPSPQESSPSPQESATDESPQESSPQESATDESPQQNTDDEENSQQSTP